MNIPPSIWGRYLSVVGVAIVYFVSDENKDQVKTPLLVVQLAESVVLQLI